MMSIADVCRGVVEDVQGALACSVVDINTGMLLGTHHIVPHFTDAYLDAIAAATVEMFRGRTVKRVEELLSKQRGSPVRESLEEIFLASPNVFHFMKLIREKDAVVVLVTRKHTSQGMGWALLRNAVSDFANVLPQSSHLTP